MKPGSIDGSLPSSLLDAVGRHASSSAGLSELPSGRRLTYAEIGHAARAWIEALLRHGLKPGDKLFHFVGDRLDLIPPLVACHAIGVGLVLCPANAKHAHAALVFRHSRAKALVGPPALRKEWSGRHGMAHWLCPHEVAAAAVGIRPPDRAHALVPEPGSLALGVAKDAPRAGPVWITRRALHRTVANFACAYPVGADDRVMSASSPLTLPGLCTAVVIPMMVGADLVAVDDALLERPAAFWEAAERTGATVCEIPASGIARLLRNDAARERQLPACIRFLLAGSGILPETVRLAAERAWGRRVYDGYGTPMIGFWAACRPYATAGPALRVGPDATDGLAFAIRPLRKPLRRLSAADGLDSSLGEIMLRAEDDGHGEEKEHRTGDLGCLTGTGSLLVADRLANVAVREGRALLLTEIDRVLAEHPRVTESKTFHEPGQGPGERVVSAYVTDLAPADIHAWLARRVHRLWVPDAIVPVGRIPSGPGLLGPLARLRDMVGGVACNEVLAVLTARRFRRNPPHKENELRALVQQAVLGLSSLNFLTFWGCGPRWDTAEPDFVALAAAHDLLDTVARTAQITTRLEIIFTDVHASSNGRAPEHSAAYFAAIERAAAGPNVSFARESEIWERRGLTLDRVRALAATAEFEEHWRRFPLRERFVLQASRHSSMQDRTEAARQYYAICFLEREVFERAYPHAIFLTYNGPEFNDCFPDLPTLYIYPGPRGRTDKPWFVRGPEQGPAEQPRQGRLRLAS